MVSIPGDEPPITGNYEPIAEVVNAHERFDGFVVATHSDQTPELNQGWLEQGWHLHALGPATETNPGVIEGAAGLVFFRKC